MLIQDGVDQLVAGPIVVRAGGQRHLERGGNVGIAHPVEPVPGEQTRTRLADPGAPPLGVGRRDPRRLYRAGGELLEHSFPRRVRFPEIEDHKAAPMTLEKQSNT